MATQPKVAIVGAGPAGLTAALRLTGRARIDVLEAGPEVGGRARTDRIDGFRVDAGAQLVGSHYTRFLSILREADGAGRIVRPPGRDALVRGGRLHEVRYGSVASLLASGALPLRTKLRLGSRYLPFLSRHADVLRIDRLEAAVAAGLDGESIAEWGRREMGEDFVSFLAHPLLASAQGLAPEETTAALFHSIAMHGREVEVLALEGGIGGFCGSLANAVTGRGGRLRTGVRVRAVRPVRAGVRVETDAGEEEYDGVVIAIPPGGARKVLPADEPAVAWLTAARGHPALVVALLRDAPLGVDWFGASFARGEGSLLSSVTVQENKRAGLVPRGRGLVVAVVRPEEAAGRMRADPGEVVSEVVAALEEVVPGAAAGVLRARVFRWADGWTGFPPGVLGRIHDFRAGEVAEPPGVVLAGDYLAAPCLEGAVLSGERAAARLLARLPPGPVPGAG